METRGSGRPGVAGNGHRLDRTPDAAWARAVRGLTAELQSWGLEARVDRATGTVEAAGAGGRRVQRAVLRPHRGSLWWWLRWEAEGLPCGAALPQSPLTPAADPRGAARRIVRVLSPARPES